jgi:hypothetical protein
MVKPAMEDHVQAREEQITSRMASNVLIVLGISTSVLFLAVAGAEVLFREWVPGGPALGLFFATSVFFGVIALFLSSILWVVNKTPLDKKREESGGKKVYSLTAIASVVALFTCIAIPLAPLFGVVSLMQNKRSGGRLSGMGRARAGILLGSTILIILMLMKQNGYTTVKTNTEAAKETMRGVYTAEYSFKTELHLDQDGDGIGEYGTISELHAGGYLLDVPADENGVREGYRYAIIPSPSDPESSFFVSARPLLNWNTPGDRPPVLFTGDRCFYMDETGILWQHMGRRATESMTAAELATEGWTVVEKIAH